MIDDNEFDEALRKKLSESSISYSEDKWLQTEKLIIIQEKKKRRIIFFFLSTIFILFTFVLYKSGSEFKPNKQRTEVLKEKMITNEIQNADVENTPTSKIIQPKEIKVLSNRNSNSLPKRPIHKKANRSNKTITIDNSNSTAYNPNNTASSSNINFSSQQILTQDTSNPLQNDSTNVSEIQPSPSIATANEWDVDTIALIKQEFLDPSNLKNNSTNIINTKADSVKTKIIDTNKRKLKFYIQIGMSMNSTFQTRADGDLLNSIDPVVGIGVKYLLNDDFQIDIGLQYTSLSGFHQSKQVEDIEYGFGFNKQVSILSTKKLHAVEAPISIHFKLNPKYSLQTGINAHYNFLSSGSLQTYEENNSGKFNNNLKNAVGYKDEFNKFDIQPLLGIQRSLYDKRFIVLQLYIGLISQRPNIGFSDTNRGIKISFIY